MINHFISRLMGLFLFMAGCRLGVDQVANEEFTLHCDSALPIECKWSQVRSGCSSPGDSDCPTDGDRPGGISCKAQATPLARTGCQVKLARKDYPHICSEKEIQAFKDDLVWLGPGPAPQSIQIMPLGDGTSGCEVKMYW